MASEYAATMDGSGKAVDFGILPNPKLSSEQAKYKHTIDDHMIYICVPRTCADRTRISDFLTLYAYHSYHTVYAKYLELYKYTYTTDAKAGEMVDIILGSRCFDLADHLSWGPNDPEYVGAGVEHTYVTSVTAGKNPIPALLENKIGDIIENCGNMYKDYLAENNG